MKRIILSVAVFTGITIVSCSKDDSNNSNINLSGTYLDFDNNSSKLSIRGNCKDETIEYLNYCVSESEFSRIIESNPDKCKEVVFLDIDGIERRGFLLINVPATNCTRKVQ